MADSKIEWTDATENIFVVTSDGDTQDGWYCEKVSPGCQNCYAERINGTSFYNGNGMKYVVPRDGIRPSILYRSDVTEKWARMRKPKKHFINSMTDTFGEWVPTIYLHCLFDDMRRAEDQTFQVLTKRPRRAREFIFDWLKRQGLSQLPSNIWIGASVEDQKRADERIPELLRIPAKVLFLSVEPLLGPVSLGFPFVDGNFYMSDRTADWVIVGGESGSGKRPMNPDWARSVRDQCQAAGVPFFMKQMDKVQPIPDDLMIREFPNVEV